MTCPNCGSENVKEGMLCGHYGVTFIEKGMENKLFPPAKKVRACACFDCGTMFDFRIELKEKREKK